MAKIKKTGKKALPTKPVMIQRRSSSKPGAGPKKPVMVSNSVSLRSHTGAAYKNLTEVRRKIDDLDRVIVPLLCERLTAVTQAAHFKPSVKGVVKKARVESIVSKVRRASKALKSNPDAIEAVYRKIIDVYTKEEQRNWKVINKK